MIIIHSSDTRDRLVAVIGLGPLRRRNAVRFDEPPTAPSVRVFMGAAAIDRCRDVLAASASPLGLRPAHDDRSLCLLLHRGDMIAADSVCQIAARHAVISTVVEAASAKRMRLRWSDIGPLATRDRERSAVALALADIYERTIRAVRVRLSPRIQREAVPA